MDYIRFFLQNKRLVSFGFLLTFFSSFGQTFLLSLYVPRVINEYQLSNSSFGGMYAAATVSSSLILVYVGKLIDTVDLRKYTLFAGITLMTACFTLAISSNLAMVFLALLGLRFAGQGLLSHISNTSMAKHFDKSRGKALSISNLGFSGGEALFPIIISSIIVAWGWRISLFFSTALIGLIFVPFVWFVLSKYLPPENITINDPDAPKFSRLSLFKDTGFYILAANVVVVPFLFTGLLFYQTQLADSKGWALEWLSFCFVGYAVGRIIFTLISGKFIDKYTALKLLPFHLIPFILGVLTLLLSDHEYAAFVYLALTGVTMGLNTTLKSAAIAEVYDVRFLGGIKSLFATLTVLGTALSPLLFGLLLDGGYGFVSILYISGACLIFVMLISIQFILVPKFVLNRS